MQQFESRNNRYNKRLNRHKIKKWVIYIIRPHYTNDKFEQDMIKVNIPAAFRRCKNQNLKNRAK